MSHWDGQLSSLANRLPSRESRLPPTLPQVTMCSSSSILLCTLTPSYVSLLVNVLSNGHSLLCLEDLALEIYVWHFKSHVSTMWSSYFLLDTSISIFHSLYLNTYQMHDWCYLFQLKDHHYKKGKCFLLMKDVGTYVYFKRVDDEDKHRHWKLSLSISHSFSYYIKKVLEASPPCWVKERCCFDWPCWITWPTLYPVNI